MTCEFQMHICRLNCRFLHTIWNAVLKRLVLPLLRFMNRHSNNVDILDGIYRILEEYFMYDCLISNFRYVCILNFQRLSIYVKLSVLKHNYFELGLCLLQKNGYVRSHELLDHAINLNPWIVHGLQTSCSHFALTYSTYTIVFKYSKTSLNWKSFGP